MSRPLRSKPIGEPDELGLVDRLEYHSHRLLDYLVLQCGDAERTCSTIPFGNVYAPHRQRMVTATMDAVLQLEQAFAKTLAVLLPRDLVHSSRCLLAQACVRFQQQRHLDVTEQVGPFVFRLLLGSLSQPLQVRERISPALCQGCVSCNSFPLGRGPFLHRLEGRYPHLRRYLRYYDRVRFLTGRLRGLWLMAFPRPPATHHRWRGISEASRFPCKRHSGRAKLIRPRRDCTRHVHTCRRLSLAFPVDIAGRLPRRVVFRGSIARPVHWSTYASPRGSLRAAQGSISQGWTPPGVGL